MEAASRDNEILDHIGLYRITLRRVLSRLFFEGGSPGNVLQRLRSVGFIQERTELPGAVNYYQLTAKGSAWRGISAKRARPFRFQSLSTHLAVLWFCCMAEARRKRLERPQLQRLFGEELTNGPIAPHCIEEREGQFRLYRIFVVSPTSGVASFVHRVQGYVSQAQAKPKTGDWLLSRQYRFVALCEDEQKNRVLDDALGRHGLKRFVGVEYAPGHRSIGRAIHERANTGVSVAPRDRRR